MVLAWTEVRWREKSEVNSRKHKACRREDADSRAIHMNTYTEENFSMVFMNQFMEGVEITSLVRPRTCAAIRERELRQRQRKTSKTTERGRQSADGRTVQSETERNFRMWSRNTSDRWKTIPRRCIRQVGDWVREKLSKAFEKLAGKVAESPRGWSSEPSDLNKRSSLDNN